MSFFEIFIDFDPGIELEKRAAEAAATQEAHVIPLLTDADTEYLNKIREETIKWPPHKNQPHWHLNARLEITILFARLAA